MSPIKKISRKILLIVAAFVIGLIAASSISILAVEAAPQWSYGGAENPTRWGDLSTDFAMCEIGKEQSPINIAGAAKGSPAKIVFHYSPAPLVVFNNGHTIQVNYAKGSTVTIDGNEYELLQFHFHTPSEHTIDGKASAMELHLVHRNTAGKLAVVGIMLDEGSENPLINEIWQNIPAAGKTNKVSDRTINAADFLPKSKAYFSYNGSLTTPPCSESVKWNVLVEPITVSEAEIDVFQKLYQVDARPVQPTNGRVITLHRE
ncbi:carbonic anhydrase [Tumidithrix helvetica PCC 7403]|uniref:carbonic anhydrase n=1 Tax=Tumidithrix helvetica TaxID=3457545 RepID=UPI003C9F3136